LVKLVRGGRLASPDVSDRQDWSAAPEDGGAPPAEAAAVEDLGAAPAEDPSRTAEEDIRRLEAIDAELAGVDVALRRLDEGSYGTCEVCGAALGAGVLEADPLAVRCPAHPG
jgi:RNA polymerase-binding transcription factor DksA